MSGNALVVVQANKFCLLYDQEKLKVTDAYVISVVKALPMNE